jgi:molecular chaperone DnaK (HSP70)
LVHQSSGSSLRPERQTAIGIDLGTSFSCVSLCTVVPDSDGSIVHAKIEFEEIEDRDGETLTPSFVAFDENGHITVGESAREELTGLNPESVFYGIKRFIGRKFQNITESEMKHFPFTLKECQAEEGDGLISSYFKKAWGYACDLLRLVKIT